MLGYLALTIDERFRVQSDVNDLSVKQPNEVTLKKAFRALRAASWTTQIPLAFLASKVVSYSKISAVMGIEPGNSDNSEVTFMLYL